MLQILGRAFSMLRYFTPELCEVLYERVRTVIGGEFNKASNPEHMKKRNPLVSYTFLALAGSYSVELVSGAICSWSFVFYEF